VSSHATSCIQTLDYLLAKHDKMLRELMTEPRGLLKIQERDRPPRVVLTEEEHDRILALCLRGNRNNGSDIAIARLTGRSHATVRNIRRLRHPLYDKKRCSRLYPAS
jgi:hypothetical protein